MDIAFGPVPSRRLGKSLGINNIPPKICSYSCIYCQLGNTIKLQVKRMPFYDPYEIYEEVSVLVEKVRAQAGEIDYLTFVPDGEPTLDVNLGREIKLLRALGIRIAVISNASLLWRDDVREDLMAADWVSLKLDSMIPDVWHKVNRPHGALELFSILKGMLDFRRRFRGKMVTETMLVKGINDSEESLLSTAEFLGQIKPATAYISVPTRPPAENYAVAPDEKDINRAYQVFSDAINRVELLIGYEGNAFASTGDAARDILSITAVHPMREDAVIDLLSRSGADFTLIEELVGQGLLIPIRYRESTYYLRKLSEKETHRPLRGSIS